MKLRNFGVALVFAVACSESPTDSTGASDSPTTSGATGTEYMATALIIAHDRWGDSGKFDYANEARWVLDIIRTKYFHTDPHLVKFVSNSNNTDPSYILPAFYQVWACFDPDNSEFWNTAITDGREYFHVGVDGNGVCPYQSAWDGSRPHLVPVSNFLLSKSDVDRRRTDTEES